MKEAARPSLGAAGAVGLGNLGAAMHTDRNPFGTTGLRSSRLGFGAQHIGEQPLAEKDVERMLNEVLDAGINFIDTSIGYGRSQEFIGKYIGHRRREFIISSKVGYGIQDVPNWTYDAVAWGIDRCLKELRTDHIEIMHLHSCSAEMLQKRKVVEALEKARQDGKIGSLGYAARSDALEYVVNCGKFHALETSVNIADQHDLDELLPRARRLGMGTIAKHPVANVVWTLPPETLKGNRRVFLDRLGTMKLDLGGMDVLEAMLRFVCYCPEVDTAIVGMLNVEQLRQNAALVDKGPLPPEIYRLIREAFRRHDQGWVSQV